MHLLPYLRKQFIINYFSFQFGVTFLTFWEYITECEFKVFYVFNLFIMKKVFASNEKRVLGIEVLNEQEMLKVRGGSFDEPERPITKSVDEYDEEDD
jgi:hypothetical protein